MKVTGFSHSPAQSRVHGKLSLGVERQAQVCVGAGLRREIVEGA